MGIFTVVMAAVVAAGLLPFYLVNVVGRRERWRRYAVAFPDRTGGRQLDWVGAFDGSVGAIEPWSRGGFNWLEIALDAEHLHVRISSSLVSSIRALRPLSLPWNDLATCAIAKGGAIAGSGLSFVFSRSASDSLKPEDLGFQDSFQVAVKFGGLKADRRMFESVVDQLGSFPKVRDRIRQA